MSPVRLNGSTSGYVELDAPAVAANNTLTLPSGGELVAATNGNINITSINGGPLAGSRNRIINGDMRIDARNNGASVTPTGGQYTLDRWTARLNASSKYSIQRNAGAVTPPPGFTNYLGVTSLSAYTLTGNESYNIEQIIEGFNVADLNWGTANAVPCTLSFWVRSSLTGTFGGSIATTKTAIWVMPFTYTISSANTWTYVTVPITAPTSTGGANTDNTEGVYVRFGFGASGTFAGGSNGVWTNAGNYIQPTGTVSVVGTNGATWYITGVQFEAGTTATPYERRSYGQELALCQRYYYEGAGFVGTGFGTGSIARATSTHPVEMRASPSLTVSNTVLFFNGTATLTATGALTNYSNTRFANADIVVSGGNSNNVCCGIVANTGKITLSAEL